MANRYTPGEFKVIQNQGDSMFLGRFDGVKWIISFGGRGDIIFRHDPYWAERVPDELFDDPPIVDPAYNLSEGHARVYDGSTLRTKKPDETREEMALRLLLNTADRLLAKPDEPLPSVMLEVYHDKDFKTTHEWARYLYEAFGDEKK